MARLRAPARRQLLQGHVDVDARKQLVAAVWTHVEYGWRRNAEDNVESAKGSGHDPICIDSVDVKSTIRLPQLLRLATKRDHVASPEKRLRRENAVIIVIEEVGAFATIRIRAAVGSKQEYAPGPAEEEERYEERERRPQFEMQRPRRKRRPTISDNKQKAVIVTGNEFIFVDPKLLESRQRVACYRDQILRGPVKKSLELTVPGLDAARMGEEKQVSGSTQAFRQFVLDRREGIERCDREIEISELLHTFCELRK